MPRRSTEEARLLEALEGLDRSGRNSRQLAREVGERLEREVDADGYCMLLMDPASHLPVYVVGEHHHDEADRLYVEQCLMRSVFTDWRHLVEQPKRVAFPDELVPGGDAKNDPLMRALVTDQGFDSALCVTFVGDGFGWGQLMLMRRQGRPPFTPRDVRLLEAAVPRVAAALRRAAFVDYMACGPGQGPGLVTLDPEGRVDGLNGVASELWKNWTEGDQGFSMALNVVGGLLRRALLDGTELPAQSVSIFDRERGERYQVRGDLLEGTDGRRRGVVLLEPLRTLDSRELRLYLGLTEREAEVVLATTRGFSTREAAGILDLSGHTVEHHLRKAFQKLGVRSRGELSALLLGG